MRVFIGYGYNDQDRWIEEYVFPLVTAFGSEVLHGKAVFGGALPEEVIRVIRVSDAMIGFTTRREAVGADQFRTHDWVVQELVTANGQVPPIPWVEVRQDGVISPGGILDAVNAQRIDYQEAERATCLVQIAQALRRFSDSTRITKIRLGPGPVVEEISGLLDDRTFSCTCQVLQGAAEFPAKPVPVFPITGALFVQLRGVASGELVRIAVSAGGRRWRSSYESVDTVDLLMKEL
jgi:hypothetical protein